MKIENRLFSRSYADLDVKIEFCAKNDPQATDFQTSMTLGGEF